MKSSFEEDSKWFDLTSKEEKIRQQKMEDFILYEEYKGTPSKEN